MWYESVCLFPFSTLLFIPNYLQNDLEPLWEAKSQFIFFIYFITFLFTFYRKILLLLAKKKRLIWPPNTFFSCSDTYNVLNLKLLPKHFCPFSFFAYIFGPKSKSHNINTIYIYWYIISIYTIRYYTIYITWNITITTHTQKNKK